MVAKKNREQRRRRRRTFAACDSKIGAWAASLNTPSEVDNGDLANERAELDDIGDLSAGPTQQPLEPFADVIAGLPSVLLTDPRSAVKWLIFASISSAGKVYVPKVTLIVTLIASV